MCIVNNDAIISDDLVTLFKPCYLRLLYNYLYLFRVAFRVQCTLQYIGICRPMLLFLLFFSSSNVAHAISRARRSN